MAKKIKPEFLFLITAIVMLSAFFIVIIYSLQFLIRDLNTALNTTNLKPTETIVNFDLQGVRELQLLP